MRPRTTQVRVGVNLPASQWEDFERVAQTHFRSRSEHIRFLISEAIKQHRDQNEGLQRDES